MSLLYECVNTVIAGENWYLVLEWVLRRGGEGTGPGGGVCDRPVPDGRPQAPPVWCKLTWTRRFLSALSAWSFLPLLSCAHPHLDSLGSVTARAHCPLPVPMSNPATLGPPVTPPLQALVFLLRADLRRPPFDLWVLRCRSPQQTVSEVQSRAAQVS